jgi:hypothetical protein
MRGRFIRPETARLELTGGDFLIVKRRLTAGEQREAYARLYVAGADGVFHVNPIELGRTTMIAYLVDWSFTDDDGIPIVIRGLSAGELGAVLDGLDPESFAEIRLAIEAHEAAITREREAEKKTRDVETRSSVI